MELAVRVKADFGSWGEGPGTSGLEGATDISKVFKQDKSLSGEKEDHSHFSVQRVSRLEPPPANMGLCEGTDPTGQETIGILSIRNRQ